MADPFAPWDAPDSTKNAVRHYFGGSDETRTRDLCRDRAAL